MKTQAVTLSLLLVVIASSTVTAQQPNSQRRLGILGGLGGAAIGAAIGEDSGDAVPGALIGGTIGLITGAAAGNAMDENEYRQRQYHSAIAQQRAQAATMSDIVSMTQAGLSDAVIISHIQTHGVAHRMTASDLIVLKQQGVSDAVLSSMQSVPQSAPIIVQPRPVVVQEHYYTHPSPAWWHHRHYHHDHGHYHNRPRSSIHFRFGN